MYILLALRTFNKANRRLLKAWCRAGRFLSLADFLSSFCHPEGSGENNLFLVIVSVLSVLGHPKGEGGGGGLGFTF